MPTDLTPLSVYQAAAGWDAAAMLDALPDSVNRYRIADLAILYCNATWAAQYAVDPVDAIGRPLDEFLSDDEQQGLRLALTRLGPDNPVVEDTIARAVPNHPGKWLQWVDRYLIGPTGPEVLSIGRDVTERHVAEMRLAESEARFRDLADRSSDIIWHFVAQPEPHFDYISPSVENILGYPPSHFLADFRRILDVLDEEGRESVTRAMRGELRLDRIDFRFRHADGSIVIGETCTTQLPAGGLQGVSRDVTELRILQDRLATLATRDPLTGLANRRLLEELLDAELARTERTGSPLAVAYLDLDDLKHVNDTFGHDAGDAVLRETARRLVDMVGPTDLVARLGGDEFVIVYEPGDEDPCSFVERVDGALSAPIEIGDGASACCRASVGIADSRVAGRDRARLMAAADIAMYEVKRPRQAGRIVGDRP